MLQQDWAVKLQRALPSSRHVVDDRFIDPRVRFVPRDEIALT